jgi:hypothetical protein
MPVGNYFLISCADDLKAVGESKEDNNCRSAVGTATATP